MLNLKGITNVGTIRDELLRRGLQAGERQLTIRGVELVAAITGIHPSESKFGPPVDEPPLDADLVTANLAQSPTVDMSVTLTDRAQIEKPPAETKTDKPPAAAPAKRKRNQTKSTRSKRTRTRKKK